MAPASRCPDGKQEVEVSAPFNRVELASRQRNPVAWLPAIPVCDRGGGDWHDRSGRAPAADSAVAERRPVCTRGRPREPNTGGC